MDKKMGGTSGHALFGQAKILTSKKLQQKMRNKIFIQKNSGSQERAIQ